MEEKTADLIGDIDRIPESDCCGALIVLGDICFECKEHCEPYQDETCSNS